MIRARLAAACVAVASLAGAAAAETCRPYSYAQNDYIVCEVAAGADLRLFLNDPAGGVYGSFQRVERAAAAIGARVVFAMNAGMYHGDRRPVGLYIADGVEVAPIVTAAGPGNFGLLPNGVFCVETARLSVIESRGFAAAPPPCRHASQSGPMLVIDGALHPRFLPNSPSRFIRNGVGVTRDGARAFFVISQGRVNFHDFAVMFRDGLGVRNALYFDGNISRLYAPALGRSDLGLPLGPIVALLAPAGG